MRIFGESSPRRLNELETRVERLEQQSVEERIRVLTLMEKVLHRLNARVSKRERDADKETDESPGSAGEVLTPQDRTRIILDARRARGLLPR